MRNLLAKEFRLSAHILSYLFIAFGAMAMIPGYPITLGAFFVCLGLFQTFQAARENNDVLFTALLPVAKTDVVRARYAFVVC
ncbi:MAG: ABC-2 transporter permease, partial [Eggerthellaceae bacterium]|nr:ABC-2 transporter permease [Eggerthellaceae bacterium]